VTPVPRSSKSTTRSHCRLDLVRYRQRALVIDGKPISRPITFEVIGDPNSLEEAAQFRAGSFPRSRAPRSVDRSR
jgi:uncharacterized protein YlxW (UPF0749 family)